jgi:hypothetical protein
MSQRPLFTEDRTKYLVKHNNNVVTAWRMGEWWCFPSYGVAKDVEVLERIGNEREVFNSNKE